MKGLKFLLFLTVIFILLVLFMLPFYYGDLSSFLSDLNTGKSVFNTLQAGVNAYWQHMDGWSALGFVFLASCIMIIHGISDHVVLFRLNKFYSGVFALDGLLWLGKRVLSLLFTTLIFIFLANLFVDFYTNKWIYLNPDEIKEGKYTVLLLGTNKFLPDGVSENMYYTHRIEAVYELYEAGYVREVWVSGDNSREDYNEPLDMKRSLIERGIPARMIKLDFAGFRTLDSIVRAQTSFDLQNLIIVSQGFHLQRALFLAAHFGVYSKGYRAEGDMTFGMFIREHLAVPKMILDIVVLNTQPKHGSTSDRRGLNFNQEDIVLVSFVLILFALGAYVSYDAFDFGK